FLFAGKSEQPVPEEKIGIISPLNFVISALAVILGSLFGFLLRDILGQINLLFLMLLPVVLIAIFLGRGPSIFAAVLSVLIFDFLFIPPYFTFAVSDVRYFLSYILFIAFAFVISNLASNLQYKVQQLQQSESRNTALYELSQDLVTAQNIDQVLHLMIRHARQIFQCDMAIFLPENGEVSVGASTDRFQVNQKEFGIAAWVWHNGEPAGMGTDTLPEAWAYYLPMKTTDTVKGVVGFHFDNPEQILTPENKVVIDTIARLGALAIERIGAEGDVPAPLPGVYRCNLSGYENAFLTRQSIILQKGNLDIMLKDKTKLVIWPVYLDATKSRGEGRILSAKVSVKSPVLREIEKAARELNLNPLVETDKSYPKSWWQTGGRVLVDKKGPKSLITKQIALKINETRTKK
ncbi:MAG: signal recognition particle protein Srp19, partial [Candidatus Methanoperedens sp.]